MIHAESLGLHDWPGKLMAHRDDCPGRHLPVASAKQETRRKTRAKDRAVPLKVARSNPGKFFDFNKLARTYGVRWQNPQSNDRRYATKICPFDRAGQSRPVRYPAQPTQQRVLRVQPLAGKAPQPCRAL
jgi:hypothetical protein